MLNDTDARADAIGQAAPFCAWPRTALLRLAQACAVARYPSDTRLITDGEASDAITIVVQGVVVSSVSNPGGRRVIFKFDDASYAYGLMAFIDGLPTPHDLVSSSPVTVIRVPHTALRHELTCMPSLWESVALESTRRGRGDTMQMQQFVFDAPLVRAASLLVGMLAKDGQDGQGSKAVIDLHLPQERLGELVGTSRQWATGLVRELTQAGLVEWRYGRVTVLDVPALRALAAKGIAPMGRRRGDVSVQGPRDQAAAARAGVAPGADPHAGAAPGSK